MATRKTKVQRTVEWLDKYLANMGSPRPSSVAVYADQLEALKNGKKLHDGKYRGVSLFVVSKPSHLIQENEGAAATAPKKDIEGSY